uniref:Uncharacterized protein n=1 Tax=Rhabditophanes sp. KR3021 TaxID=114890 RepID=A0AC35UA40_9BILA
MQYCFLLRNNYIFKAKHESFLEEEKDILNRGLENTKQLLLWYEERWETLKKRKDMLNRGLVALDTSVHAQKLNFLRAQITNLNNRIKDLLLSTEFGMPANAVIGNNNLKMKMDKDQIPLIRMPKREVKLSDFQNTNDVRHEGQSQAKTQTKLRNQMNILKSMLLVWLLFESCLGVPHDRIVKKRMSAYEKNEDEFRDPLIDAAYEVNNRQVQYTASNYYENKVPSITSTVSNNGTIIEDTAKTAGDLISNGVVYVADFATGHDEKGSSINDTANFVRKIDENEVHSAIHHKLRKFKNAGERLGRNVAHHIDDVKEHPHKLENATTSVRKLLGKRSVVDYEFSIEKKPNKLPEKMSNEFDEVKESIEGSLENKEKKVGEIADNTGEIIKRTGNVTDIVGRKTRSLTDNVITKET